MSKEISDHFGSLKDTLETLNQESIDSFAISLTAFLRSGSTLFVGGNGGSQSIAEHICTDWTKGIFEKVNVRLRILSLNSITPLLTAISNDLGYENSLSLNFQILSSDDDAIFLISSSGRSPNILRAAEMARNSSKKVFAFSGFGSSELCQLADEYITIDSDNYQVIEDIHAILGHAIFKHLLSNI